MNRYACGVDARGNGIGHSVGIGMSRIPRLKWNFPGDFEIFCDRERLHHL